ncbi:MAG TPA: D-glycero-beta-D-manno-heptose 1-phosphate adenylyltransferase [Gemmatimonadaceae bacterium]|nr:D-glycero-beta-D-manno-heptose 1-phosphate adenylyltransferase [Gemmatimonadaceae bacterium]
MALQPLGDGDVLTTRPNGPAGDPPRKILTWKDARDWRARARTAGETVVFTNGVFDLLHPGHIDLLCGARAEGDRLVVGLNSDASARRLGKGPDRPVRPEGERAYVLAAIEAVDAVVVFDEDTPLALVRHLEPDVIVKGGDYAPSSVVGAAEVTARGGRVVIVPLTPGQSTSAILERLRGGP